MNVTNYPNPPYPGPPMPRPSTPTGPWVPTPPPYKNQ